MSYNELSPGVRDYNLVDAMRYRITHDPAMVDQSRAAALPLYEVFHGAPDNVEQSRQLEDGQIAQVLGHEALQNN